MRTCAVVVAVATLASGCDSPPAGLLSDAHSAAMEDSIASMLNTWSEGTREGEWDRLVDRYADRPDFRWVKDGSIRYRSVDEIGAAVDGLESAYSGEQTEFTEPSVTPLAPGVAHVTSRFRTTLRRESGPDVRYGGAMTMTVVHTSGGWKVLQGHTSTERQTR